MAIWFLTFLWMNSRIKEAERKRVAEQQAIEQQATPRLRGEKAKIHLDDRLEQLRETVARNPKSPQALQAMLEIPQLLAKRQRWKEAAQAWEQVAKTFGRGPYAAHARYQQALICGERLGEQKRMEKLLGGLLFQTKAKVWLKPETESQAAVRFLLKLLWERQGYDTERVICVGGSNSAKFAVQELTELFRAKLAEHYVPPRRVAYDPDELVAVPASRAAGQRLDIIYKDRLRYKMMAALVGIFNPEAHPEYAYAMGVLLLALLVKIVLYPLNARSYVSMKEMQLKTKAIQPLLEDLKRRYKDDQLKFMQEQNKLFKKHGISPMKGCLPMLIQMPILIAIYYAVRMYSFQFSHGSFLWIKDLSQPDLPLMLVYVGTMILTTKLQPTTSSGDKQQEQTQKMMTYLMPIMILFFFRSLPAAFILYWTAFNVLNTAQQLWLNRQYKELFEKVQQEQEKPAQRKPARIKRKQPAATGSSAANPTAHGGTAGGTEQSQPSKRPGAEAR